MSQISPDPASLTAELSALRADLGGDQAGLRLDVVGLAAPQYRTERGLSQVEVDVLITAGGDDPMSAAQRVVGAVLSLWSAGTWQTGPAPSEQFWLALGRPPQAAFVVKVPVSAPLVRPAVQRVRHELELQSGSTRHIGGHLLAPDGTPIARGRVRLRPDGLWVETDSGGGWSLTVPDLDIVLEVNAKGLTELHHIRRDTLSPLVLTLAGLDQPAQNPNSATDQRDAHERP